MADDWEAVVVGAGPNGLTAAATLGRAGWRVLVVEAAPTIGGGTRSGELTRPGFVHDICSAVHPMALISPALSPLDLDAHGVKWVFPEVQMAHPLDGGRAALLLRSVGATAARLGPDQTAYRALFDPLVESAGCLVKAVMSPFTPAPDRRPAPAGRIRPDRGVAGDATGSVPFQVRRRPGAHLRSGGPLDVVAPLGRDGRIWTVSWPARTCRGLARRERWFPGHCRRPGCDHRGVRRRDHRGPDGRFARPAAPGPRHPAGCRTSRADPDRRPSSARPVPRRLERYRPGAGVWKVDWALDGPVPWTAEGAAGPPRCT